VDRVRAMYDVAYGRGPSSEEASLATAFVRGEADWARLAHALILANELAFVD